MTSYEMSDIFHMSEDDLTQLSQLSDLTSSSTFDFGDSAIQSSQASVDAQSSTSSIWTARTFGRRSWIWRHGDEVLHEGKRYWKCNLCKSNKRYGDGSTKHPIEHLQRDHKMTRNGPVDTPATNIIRQAFGSATPKIQFNLEVFKQLLAQWMVGSNISFRQVEDPQFRLLLSYLTSVSSSYVAIPKCLPKSGNTVRAWLLAMYNEQKDFLIQGFKDINQVHFSFNL